MIIIFHALVHFLGLDYGVAYGHLVWYNFWSGVAGSFLVASIVWTVAYYINHTCHDHPTCFRWGKYPAANGMFKLCWKHHPDMGVRPHREMIRALHDEYKKVA
jgi:hypothetical protein